MISIKKLKASLAVFMILALVLTPFTSNAAVTKQIPKNAASMNESLQVAPELKINSEVKNALTGGRYVEVLVSMNEQVDTAKVARETEATISAKTPYQKKIASRYAVVDKLQETAKGTQENVLKLLEVEKKNGNVLEYRSFYIVNMVYVKATADVIKKLSMRREVKEISLNSFNKIVWPKITNNVNNNEIQSVEWNIDKIGATAVWNGFSINGSGVVVGLIDTGFDYTHEALKTKWRGYNPADPNNPNPVGNWLDTVNGQSLPYDIPEIPHGTHVSGTILGQDPDGENIIGVAPGAKIIIAKAFTADGGTDADLLEAGEWMLAPNNNPSLAPDVINNSWGGGSGMDEWYRSMVQAWRSAGILPVFSAGNEDPPPAPPASVSSPGNYPESFTVGATDRNDLRGDFSQLGPAPYAAPNDLKPDIAAPGVNVRSSVLGGGYQAGWSGTSMAAPHITGTAALLLSYDAALTPDQIEQIITSTATPLTDSDYPNSPNYGYGYGLVNAFNAVSSIASGIGTIQGKVLKPGVDSEDAVINHAPLTEAFSSVLPTLTASVTDNISVGDVEAYIKPNGAAYWAVVPMTRTSGDAKSGVYTCNIPGEFVREPGFQYKIRAYDYGQNITETQVYSVTVKFGVKPGEFSTNFSESPSTWLMDYDWEWGETNTGVAPAGDKLVATKLNGNYTVDTVSSLITPPIDMRNAASASLNLRHWYDTETNYDKCYVAVSNDYGDNWTIKNTLTGHDKTWRNLTVNLDQFANSPTPVFVMFQLSADYSLQYDGWYIDDVNLAAGTSSITAPARDRIPERGIVKDSKPAEFKGVKVNSLKQESKYYISKNEINAQPGLPLDATVTILETGRTVRTNPFDGSYKLTHAAGDNWTLLVESYGFLPAKEKVALADEQVINKNFMMQEIPKGSVSGHVVNERNNAPIAGAVIKVAEDFHVTEVTTDANGYYTIPEVYEGQYTLKISAENYKPAQASVNIVGGANSVVNVALKPFIGTADELGYDDGTAENAYALNSGGNAWAVRMTPSGLCMVKAARVFIYDNSWPVPGGNTAKFAIYDSLPNGDPGKEVFRTDVVQVVRGQWNDIDLSGYGFSTDRDFYVAMVQLNPNPNCPGMAIDEDSDAGRSYLVVDGTFIPLADEGISGNLMIRAKVSYELLPPTIKAPVNGAFTNSNNVDVKGTVGTDSLVKIYVNNQVAGEAQTVDKAYTINVPLAEGENIIKATATLATGETDPSAPVTVIRDITAPVLEVTAPVDGMITNKEVVDVAGKVIETYLSEVTVNGQKVNVAQDGSFSTRVIVNSGANVITVIATDKAGNKTTVERTVNVGLALPTITDIMPNTDLTVKEGDVVTISFHSDAIGGVANYRVLLPLGSTPTYQGGPGNMSEVSNGYYVGSWTVPGNLSINGAIIEVEVTNTAGNKATAQANGKINVYIPKTPPVLTPDLDWNTIGEDILITFEDNAEWRAVITNIKINGLLTTGGYSVMPGVIKLNAGTFTALGNYQVTVEAQGYRDAIVTQPIQEIPLLTPPTLVPSTRNNMLGRPITITFADNAAWRQIISDITINGQSIAGKYTIYAGSIVINASAFPTAGSYTVAVKAKGYKDAVVIQVIQRR